ncbi:hypothetical protein JTE90_007926 [Oedothorax gibbosus]|uniref:C2H2-type domain-containing protein n=1 Tax=Oedothorax gibbosus TaxID=931172 RepID=A0AAV6VJ98_9ARAC|nr:hypothetical protein JTE90_007926 [Oedothorax gibbosus]
MNYSFPLADPRVSYLARMQKRRILCRYCPFATDSAFDLQNHLCTHAFTKNTYQCDVCLKFFSLSTDLLTHFKTQHN